MKIRIRDNSLRLRLSQSEIAGFLSNHKVTSEIFFPNGLSIKYTLIWSLGDAFDAHFNGKEIMVSLPHEIGYAWASSDQVGINAEIPLTNDQSLKLLVEKDFKCLSDRDEDESDMFANPNQSC